MDKEKIGMLEVFFSSLLFGLIPILVRFDDSLGPFNLSFFRVFVATIALFLFIIFSKRVLSSWKKETKKLVIFGALHGFIIICYFIAIKYLSIASAVLLLYSCSIWVVVFSYLILKERIKKISWIALLIAFIGVVLVVSPKDFFLQESIIGSLAGLAGGIIAGLVYTLSKTFKEHDKVSLTFWQNLIALPFLFPLIFIDLPYFTMKSFWIVIFLGTVCTAIPFILIFKGFQKIPSQKGSVLILLDLVFAVVFASILFKEIPSLIEIIGGVLILIGSYLITK